MMLRIWTAAALAVALPIAAFAQTPLVDVMQRHGVEVKRGAFDVAFDAYAAPTIPVTPGSFATLLVKVVPVTLTEPVPRLLV